MIKSSFSSIIYYWFSVAVVFCNNSLNSKIKKICIMIDKAVFRKNKSSKSQGKNLIFAIFFCKTYLVKPIIFWIVFIFDLLLEIILKYGNLYAMANRFRYRLMIISFVIMLYRFRTYKVCKNILKAFPEPLITDCGKTANSFEKFLKILLYWKKYIYFYHMKGISNRIIAFYC